MPCSGCSNLHGAKFNYKKHYVNKSFKLETESDIIVRSVETGLGR